ncbi:putative uncharacterized protein DDB_G0277255 isoform X1 [Aedes albopictus]|uniref:Alpha-protein kinase 1 n=1 Tax=Aedes albopictus TaxID=7160 RepID=A0ABM1YAI5_AEDAL|nr:putative uncharacterized protein DDB_G0277255 isoform X1 [Aedes albopictus]
MEKSFDDITVSSLSDLQLVGNSVSGAGVTIPDHLREAAAQLINSSNSNNNNSNSGGGGQQQRNSSINGNAAENNLNRAKKSSTKSVNLQQQQQPQQSVLFNPPPHSKHLDVWLANAIRGLENSSSQDSPDQLDSPTPKGSYGEPLSLPPNLNYLDGPNSSSPFSTGLFSPTQLLLQQPPPIGSSSGIGSIELGVGGGGVGGCGGGGGAAGGVIQQNPYRFGGGSGISSHQYLLNDSSEFASLPPRINHQQQQQQLHQSAGAAGRRNLLQRNQSSSFQDLLNAQRIMTDSYINDSSDNESKNSCAKSKLEMAETLLADLNLLNNGGSGTSTASGGGIVVGNGIGYNNGNSATSTASGVNQSNGGNNNSNNNSNNNNNLVVVLLKEISKLHETNKKICRNLHETKVEMEALKHSSHWGLSHRRDSISGLSTNSQPVGMRSYNSFGLQSPAPTYHSQGSYSPGLVADVIREIREVSRVREEAMMDRMKTMIEERSWALNETNFRLLKETEEAKKGIHLVRSEMNQMVDRMLKLENEVINLRAQLNNQQLQQQQQQQQQQHQQQLHLRERDSYGQSSAGSSSAKHRRNSMHLNYGRINNTDEFYGGNNFNDLSNELRFGNGNGGNLRGSKIGENTFVGGQTLNGAGGGSSYGDEMHEDSASDQVLLLEKDALKLRRELQDALASKQESENRITALESIVSTLKEQVPPAVTSSGSGTQQSLTGVKGTTTTMTTMNATSALNPVGMVGASGHHQHHHPHQQQQQHQPNHHHQYYFRSINNGSPSQQQPPPPVGSISPSKFQKAAQIQSLPSPSGKQYMHLPPGSSGGTINVSGPVTDL